MKWFKQQIGGKKGFTLVEIIVVLVVLAILAAFTIPTMLGFVADAKGKAYIAEAREVYVAAQAVATEYSATTELSDGAPTSGDLVEWEGLSNSLSSYTIQERRQWKPGSDQYELSRVRASRQMDNYLGTDITISKFNVIKSKTTTPTKTEVIPGQSAWRVTVGLDESTGKTAKVTKVVYFKNGYRITIEKNNALVEKYNY
ncbi:prepilin-type N-terminal cleavage/methylation domain-containing protein [Acetobacterium wieringae]|uniref:prepilin-type N-terminal cleavage/methylation domain-containing protein n=1 Tax=Acetobacterium wieringae TaxID=52694 RepID=UPI002B217612|nr:prepilin-type N-terminal cleavage/methylation domain-containing protein [Acetobacterium wieringae]MEA4807046.1 prepilin-type N-terminal cleavage/methylation domain-containing protein [Acetobacterium wieringae]